MKEMYRTAEGTLTTDITKVYVADDGTVCETNNECSAYEKLGFKPVYPTEITFAGSKWHWPELDGYNLEVTYSPAKGFSFEEYKVSFKITEDGLFLTSVFKWDKCSELDVYEKLGDLKGTPIEKIGEVEFTLYY